MGFIYSIQICEISHQTFGPSHRKCLTCPTFFAYTVLTQHWSLFACRHIYSKPSTEWLSSDLLGPQEHIYIYMQLKFSIHDDVIKWKHFPRYWPLVRGIHRSPVNSSHKGQWRGALMFSLICARMNGWENNREAGDLRCQHIHYDVTVMYMRDVHAWNWVKFIKMACVKVLEALMSKLTSVHTSLLSPKGCST